MFFPLTPLQQFGIMGMLHNRNKIALEQSETARKQLEALREQQKTLQKIEQQNNTTLKRITLQNTETRRLRQIEDRETLDASVERAKYEEAMRGKRDAIKTKNDNTYRYKCPKCTKTSHYTPSKDRKKKPYHICPVCAYLFSDTERSLARKA
jgi:rubrerythrin